jgi:ABC-2 type transport system ATP-binding protein
MLAEAAQTVDHVMIIDRGRRVTSGRLDEITERGRSLEDVFLQLTGGAS